MVNVIESCKKIVIYSLPVIGSRLAGVLNGIISMFLIAMLGRRELAAGALISSLQITLNVVGWAILFSISAIVGKTLGKGGSKKEVGSILKEAWLVGAILSVLFTFIFWNVGPMLRFVGEDKQIVDLIEPYFHILACGVLPNMLYIAFVQFSIGVGKPKIAFYLSVMNTILMSVIGYLLLFGKLGLPKFGMTGMAYASVLVAIIACMIALFYILFNSYYKEFKIFNSSSNGLKHLKTIFKVGTPISVQFMLELTAFSFSTIMIGWVNEASLAATQIILQMNSIFMMIPFGIAQTCSVFISRSVGQRNYQETRVLAKAGLIVGFICTSLIAVFYLTCSKFIIPFYSIDLADPKNAIIVHIAVILFAIAAFSQLFDGLRNIAAGALQGFYNTRTPMIVAFIASWGITIPLGYLLGIYYHLGAPGISFGYVVAWLLGATYLIKCLYSTVKLQANES